MHKIFRTSLKNSVMLIDSRQLIFQDLTLITFMGDKLQKIKETCRGKKSGSKLNRSADAK
jgi:hypothetical protein